MRPSSAEVIGGIKWSLETYIMPDLRDPLAQSAARSMVNLLDHVRLRIETEGLLLAEDNEDKRTLFQQIAPLLKRASQNNSILEPIAAEIAEKAGTDGQAYASVAHLSQENDELKKTLYRVIRALEANKAGLVTDLYRQADEAICGQLRRQLDRENKWINEAFAGRPRF